MAEQVARPDGTAGLRRNAVGLLAAIMLSATIMGPAVSTYFNTQFTAINAGAALPFVFLVSLIAALIVANGVAEMARKLPAAGAFYTYVVRGIGPKAGFVTGTLMFLGYSLLEPAELALIGYWISNVLLRFGYDVSWILIAAIFWVTTLVLSIRGIRISMETALIAFGIEVGVIIVLSFLILGKGGAEGINLQPFDPGQSPTGIGGIALGLVFGILSFVGFEGAATLGEEVENPRVNVPRAIFGATLLVGVIYLFATWAETLGFGVSTISVLQADAAPFDTLAKNYSPDWFRVLVDIAGASSMFGVMISSHNGVTRIIYAMGREKLLPAFLGTINHRYSTPQMAIIVQSVGSGIVAIILGLAVGPFNTYGYLGTILTLGIIPVYILVNLAVIRYFRSEFPREFSVIKHLILPVAGILLMAIPIYGLIGTNPAYPYNLFPWMVLVYIVVAVVIAVWLDRTRPQELREAGKILAAEYDVADPAPATA
ncbi:MAG: APC family permease [Chloroflexi bacterium]|nr:APC family permease [Chloroflexota bacterium]